MKSIKLILATEDNFSLGLNKNQPEQPKEEKPQVTVETHAADATKANARKTVSIDADVLAVLVTALKKSENSSGNSDELAKAIKQLADVTAESNTGDMRFLGSRPIDSVQIDRDDVLSVPDIFFSNSVSFAIYDDKRAGHTIKTPYGRSFKFKTTTRVIDKTSSRSPVYTSLSAVVISSKKESQWLRSHTLFGIKFFEKKSDGKDINLEMQDKIVNSWAMVSQFEDHYVMQRCMSEGIAVDTDDISQLRRRLAFKIAQNMISSDKKRRDEIVKNQDDFLTGKIPQVTDASMSGTQLPSTY